MKFHDWMTCYHTEKALWNNDINLSKEFPFPSSREYYAKLITMLEQQGDKLHYIKANGNGDGTITGCTEDFWIRNGMPYYKVYPSIIEMLTRIDLNKVPFDQVKCPVGDGPLLATFSQESLCLGFIKSMLFNRQQSNGINGITILVDVGERSETGIIQPAVFMLNGGDTNTVGDSLDYLLDTYQYSEFRSEDIEKLAKLVVTLCLIGDSPELIQPEVLNVDKHKLTGQHNIEALVAKARRRGKYGFTIGKDIEVMPHYRRPHLVLVWTGKGRRIPMIVPRKGSIVHRAAVEKIPTGYAADEV